MKNKIQYDPNPMTKITDSQIRIFRGIKAIAAELKSVRKADTLLVLDCYPGVSEGEIEKIISGLDADLVIRSRDIFKEKEEIEDQMKYHLTEDRVFGRMYYGEIEDFMEPNKLQRARKRLQEHAGFRIVYGFGASLLARGDVTCYFDISRWEIQLRYRKGMENYKAENYQEDILKKYKRGYFIEWRIADKHKSRLFDKIDYYVDSNRDGDFRMLPGPAFLNALEENTKQPFRCVPYFDPGVWGGNWMEKTFGLAPASGNYAWSFNGVPEENSLLYEINGCQIEIPAMNLVLYAPKALLGEKVYARFGAEFPIRFDFLDTMGGQNLSLQVHPTAEYIKKNFGMAYTQDESYYILEAGENASVYLGLKEGIDKEAMLLELGKAQKGEGVFEAEKYVNTFPAKKHDHFLIPAGTCHCSGADTMVLEISATPYIFTFKLWDWGRTGLDGKPRPIHIDHGEKVIDWNRTTKWVEENLVNAVEIIQERPGMTEEHTGLHALEFVETRRFTLQDEVILSCHDSVNMLSLVEGEACVVESLDGSFAPYTVHYAEVFIVPCRIGQYKIRAKGEEIKILQAYVRV